MILDLESSAAAALLVEEPESAVPAAHRDAAVVAGDQVVSCVLLETELRRLALRVGVSQAAVTEMLDGVSSCAVSTRCKSRPRCGGGPMRCCATTFDRRRRRRTQASGC